MSLSSIHLGCSFYKKDNHEHFYSSCGQAKFSACLHLFCMLCCSLITKNVVLVICTRWYGSFSIWTLRPLKGEKKSTHPSPLRRAFIPIQIGSTKPTVALCNQVCPGSTAPASVVCTGDTGDTGDGDGVPELPGVPQSRPKMTDSSVSWRPIVDTRAMYRCSPSRIPSNLMA